MDGDEEFPDHTLRRMVREIRPEWELREVTPADEGTDAVYYVTVETADGPREYVLKVCEFLDPPEFRPEPHLLSLADRRTSIPVPAVVGAVDDHDDLPAPFFLMDRFDGEVRENGAHELPIDAIERLAHEAGRHLGEVHALGDFDAFGPVRLARDVSGGADGPPALSTDTLSADGRDLAVGEAGVDSWRTHFERIVDANFGDLHHRFADLEAPLRAFVEDRLDALARDFDPVLGHDDYRLGNLVVDGDAGETKAVLDWGNAHTLEAQYNLVLTEQYLSGWARHGDSRSETPHDGSRRERIRAALRDGYEATNHLEEDGEFERRRELYLGVTRLFPMVWFSLWYGDQSEPERERTVEKHRRAVRELVDRRIAED